MAATSISGRGTDWFVVVVAAGAAVAQNMKSPSDGMITRSRRTDLTIDLCMEGISNC